MKSRRFIDHRPWRAGSIPIMPKAPSERHSLVCVLARLTMDIRPGEPFLPPRLAQDWFLVAGPLSRSAESEKPGLLKARAKDGVSRFACISSGNNRMHAPAMARHAAQLAMRHLMMVMKDGGASIQSPRRRGRVARTARRARAP
jgi:hypothetical protein